MSSIGAGVGTGAGIGAGVGTAILPGVGTAVGAGVGGLVGGVAGWFGDWLSNKSSKSAATTAYARQKQLIAEQNAYNTPAAQMARFQSAGLNPNLVYGQGSPGNAQQSTTPAVQQDTSYRGASSGLVSGSTAGVGVALAGLQARNIEANTGNTASQSVLNRELARTEAVKQLNIVSQTGLNSINKDFLERTISDRIAQVGSESAGAGIALSRARFDLDFAKEMRPHQVNQIISTIDNSYSEMRRRSDQTSIEQQHLKLSQALTPHTISRIAQEITQSQAQQSKIYSELTQLGKDMKWNNLVRNLQKQGVDITDSSIFRRIMGDVFMGLSQEGKISKDLYERQFDPNL